MISIMDSTTKQANNVNKLGVSIQVNLTSEQIRRKDLAQSTSLSGFYTPFMSSVLLFVCPNQTSSLSTASSAITEEKSWALAFHDDLFKSYSLKTV